MPCMTGRTAFRENAGVTRHTRQLALIPPLTGFAFSPCNENRRFETKQLATNQTNIGTFNLQQHRRAREVLLGDSISHQSEWLEESQVTNF